MGSTAAPIDKSVLETIYQRAETHPLTQSIQSDRTGRTLTQVAVLFDTDQYPENIQAARIEIQWYRNGDYNFHYIETHSTGDDWQCRWDRHPNPHTTRTHFHPPPTACSNDAVPDSPSDRHPSTMFARALASIRTRLEDLWSKQRND